MVYIRLPLRHAKINSSRRFHTTLKFFFDKHRHTHTQNISLLLFGTIRYDTIDSYQYYYKSDLHALIEFFVVCFVLLAAKWKRPNSKDSMQWNQFLAIFIGFWISEFLYAQCCLLFTVGLCSSACGSCKMWPLHFLATNKGCNHEFLHFKFEKPKKRGTRFNTRIVIHFTTIAHDLQTRLRAEITLKVSAKIKRKVVGISFVSFSSSSSCGANELHSMCIQHKRHLLSIYTKLNLGLW